MQKLLITGLVLFVAVWAVAQVFGPPTIGSDGPIATSPSQCPTAPAHAYSLCPVETGTGTGALYISINGAAPVLLQGAPGPAGPMGPAGPQGPPGPAQSFTSQACTTSSLSNTGFTASGCSEK